MKSKIKEVLSFPHHYLMAEGGEGMEFLSTTISYYSNCYRSSNTSNHVTQDNRFIVNPPDFYDLLAAIGNHDDSWTMDQLINRLHDRLPNFKPDLTMEDIIDEALSFNKESLLPSLHRQHFLNCDYFTKDNTYFLYLNSFEWFLYKHWLHFHKVWTTPLPTIEHINNIIKFYYVSAPEKRLLLDQIHRLAETTDAIIYEGHLQAIICSPTLREVSEDFLNRTPIELFQDVRGNVAYKYKNYQDNLNRFNVYNRFNLIKFDGLIENLIDKFAIPKENQDMFVDRVTQWHDKNIKLISNNMDVSKLVI